MLARLHVETCWKLNTHNHHCFLHDEMWGEVVHVEGELRSMSWEEIYTWLWRILIMNKLSTIDVHCVHIYWREQEQDVSGIMLTKSIVSLHNGQNEFEQAMTRFLRCVRPGPQLRNYGYQFVVWHRRDIVLASVLAPHVIENSEWIDICFLFVRVLAYEA